MIILFQDGYISIHGYLVLLVCTVGTLFNLVNIVVLTHKDMRGNPINIILTGIAVADCLVMCEHVPFAFHMYLSASGGRGGQEERVSVLG